MSARHISTIPKTTVCKTPVQGIPGCSANCLWRGYAYECQSSYQFHRYVRQSMRYTNHSASGTRYDSYGSYGSYDLGGRHTLMSRGKEGEWERGRGGEGLGERDWERGSGREGVGGREWAQGSREREREREREPQPGLIRTAAGLAAVSILGPLGRLPHPLFSLELFLLT